MTSEVTSNNVIETAEVEDAEDYSQEEIVDTGISAIALYDYQAAADDEISFDPDDFITHIEKASNIFINEKIFTKENKIIKLNSMVHGKIIFIFLLKIFVAIFFFDSLNFCCRLTLDGGEVCVKESMVCFLQTTYNVTNNFFSM